MERIDADEIRSFGRRDFAQGSQIGEIAKARIAGRDETGKLAGNPPDPGTFQVRGDKAALWWRIGKDLGYRRRRRGRGVLGVKNVGEGDQRFVGNDVGQSVDADIGVLNADTIANGNKPFPHNVLSARPA